MNTGLAIDTKIHQTAAKLYRESQKIKQWEPKELDELSRRGQTLTTGKIARCITKISPINEMRRSPDCQKKGNTNGVAA